MAGLLNCITHIGEEMLKMLLFSGPGGWVKWLEIMLVIGKQGCFLQKVCGNFLLLSI